MIPPLPRPIADYVKANALLDVDGMLKPFSADTSSSRRNIVEALDSARPITTPSTTAERNSMTLHPRSRT